MDAETQKVALEIGIDLTLLKKTVTYHRVPGKTTIHDGKCAMLKRAKKTEALGVQWMDLHQWNLHGCINLYYSPYGETNVWSDDVRYYDRHVSAVVRHELALQEQEASPTDSIQYAANLVSDIATTSDETFKAVGKDKYHYVHRATVLYDTLLEQDVEKRYRPYVAMTMGCPQDSATVAAVPAGVGIGRYLPSAWDAWSEAVSTERGFAVARSSALHSLLRHHQLSTIDGIDQATVLAGIERVLDHWEAQLDDNCTNVGPDVLVAYHERYYYGRGSTLVHSAVNSFRGHRKVAGNSARVVVRVPERIAEGLYDTSGNIRWLGLASDIDTPQVLATMVDLWSDTGTFTKPQDALTGARMVVAGALV